MTREEVRTAAAGLSPNDVVAELVALSVVEHSYTPGTTLTVEFVGPHGTITDTGRGMQLTPDRGDRVSHAQRTLTSIYPVDAATPQITAVLTELVWGRRGSMGPAPANAACSRFQFTSRRDGAAWTQHYRFGVPLGPPTPVGRADDTGTIQRFTTTAGADGDAIGELIQQLLARVPDLVIDYSS